MNKRILQTREAWIAALFALAAITGCDAGPGNLSPVTGTITLDGQPLADATVMFTPKAEGAPSTGRTNSSGVYTLVYSQDVKGAEIGEHSVRITTYSPGDPDGNPPLSAVPEKVPARYNSKTELTAKVASGKNTLDFPLKSEDDAAQPKVGDHE